MNRNLIKNVYTTTTTTIMSPSSNTNTFQLRPLLLSFFEISWRRILLSIISCLILCSPAVESTTPLFGHCAVTHNRTIYLFGGYDVNYAEPSNYFLSFNEPFSSNTSSSPTTSLNVSGSICVAYAACVTVNDYMLIIGGLSSSSNGTTTNLIQIYDFSAKIFIDSSAKLSDVHIGPSYSPRAALISETILFIYGGNANNLNGEVTTDPAMVMFLNVTEPKWSWIGMYNQTNSIPNAAGAGIFGANGNAWVFGGSILTQNDTQPEGTTNITVFSLNYTWKSPSPEISLPTPVREAAVGVRNNSLFILGVNDTSFIVWELDMNTRELSQVSISPPITGSGFAFTQFAGSDVMVINGGTCLGSLKVCNASNYMFNMTTKSWTSRLNVVDNIPNITANTNADKSTTQNTPGETHSPNPTTSIPAVPPNITNSSSKLPVAAIVAPVVVVGLAVVSIVGVLLFKRKQRQENGNAFAHLQNPQEQNPQDHARQVSAHHRSNVISAASTESSFPPNAVLEPDFLSYGPTTEGQFLSPAHRHSGATEELQPGITTISAMSEKFD